MIDKVMQIGILITLNKKDMEKYMKYILKRKD